MTISTWCREVPASRSQIVVWLRKLPFWAIFVFVAAVAIVYSPNVIQVFGVHTDYDNLFTRNPHFLHPEAGHLFAVARPIAALFTNLMMLPVASLSDYRWTRLFSIFTLCVLGTQMIGNSVLLLRVRWQHAAAIAIATFVVPGFTYSVLVAAAWAPHLLTILIAFAAYTTLGRSNLQSIPFLISADRRDYPILYRQLLNYFAARPVWGACLLYQLALYDYPPTALIVAVFPAIGILFSQAPRTYRTLLALRDICFIGTNLIFYFVSVKLIYFPFIRHFTSLNIDIPAANLSPFLARLTAPYRFTLEMHPGQIVTRLAHLMSVTGDLWFLPQARIHLLVGVVVLVAVMATNIAATFRRGRGEGGRAMYRETADRLRFGARNSEGTVTASVLAACFIISGAPILAASGGFITYRTVAVPTAVVSIIFIYSLSVIAETLSNGIRNRFGRAPNIADATVQLAVFAAVAGGFYINWATMKLARNEFAYFTAIARQAIESRAKTVFIIDPRPIILPDDIPVTYDQRGRAAPPYELGCFSSYCLQTGSILHIALRELGYADTQFTILTPQGDEPVPGLTCKMLTAPAPNYPPNPSQRSISVINYYRTLTPLTCVDYNLGWHDLEIDLSR